MRNDARSLLNNKKWKKKSQGLAKQFGAFDARRVLNQKRGRSSIQLSKRQAVTRSVGQTAAQRTFFPSKNMTVSSQARPIAPDKHVMLANDGNIWITASSKNKRLHSPTPALEPDKNRLRWGPADIDSDDIEHIGIHDLIDMESLPSTVMSTSHSTNVIPSIRSLTDDLLQNTMVADQVAASHPKSARVLVRNLCHSVSQQDITELFGDIGLIKSIQMSQPGTALIDFYTLSDASRACETYHNRYLDGQPMTCQLLLGSDGSERQSIAERLGHRLQPPFEPSTSFVPNSRLRYNPNDVRFTVKLT